MKFNYSIKSPLRYPGGKTRALRTIIPLIPKFDEYREPFIGGGSVFFSIKQTYNGKKYWINDLNRDLYMFWKFSQTKLHELVRAIDEVWSNSNDGRELYNYYRNSNNQFTDFESAVRFFVLNRITFSGTVDAGGYTNRSYEKRFTKSSIDRLSKTAPILKNVKITNEDYMDVVLEPGNNTFLFLDPPYFSKASSRLYTAGNGITFDHEKFASVMKKCVHKWLITYDNSPEVRKLFSFAHVEEWSQKYGMGNYYKDNNFEKNELFISNYSY